MNVTDNGYNHSQDTIHYCERVVNAFQRLTRRRTDVCAHLLINSCAELHLHLSREHQSKVAALHSDKSSLVTALLAHFSGASMEGGI